MKKTLLVFVGLVFVLILGVVILLSSLGSIVENGINRAGPQILKVPVSVEQVKVGALSGNTEIKNMVIGNPEKFKSEYLFKLGKLEAGMAVRSLLSDTIEINNIDIDGAIINYEMTVAGSNLGNLMKNIKKEKPQEKEPDEEVKKEKKPGKKMIINRFTMKNTKVNVIAPGLSDSLTVDMPDIELENIGKDSQGIPVAKVSADIMKAVAEGVAESLGKSDQFADLNKQLSSRIEEAKSDLSGQAEKLKDTVEKEAEKLGVDPSKTLQKMDKLFK